MTNPSHVHETSSFLLLLMLTQLHTITTLFILSHKTNKAYIKKKNTEFFCPGDRKCSDRYKALTLETPSLNFTSTIISCIKVDNVLPFSPVLQRRSQNAVIRVANLQHRIFTGVSPSCSIEMRREVTALLGHAPIPNRNDQTSMVTFSNSLY